MPIIPKITWQISGGCSYDCWYCPSHYRNNPNYKTLDQYLFVVDKIQNHGDRKSIPFLNWRFNGGEPLNFTNFNILLRQVKSKACQITLETSGGDNWFDLLEIIQYVDNLVISHHYWQNETVLSYAIDLCKEQSKSIQVIIPLVPGKIRETREKIALLKDSGVDVIEQHLLEGRHGLHEKYSLRDLNLIYGRPEDWTPPPPAPPSKPVVTTVTTVQTAKPDPFWVDPRISNGSPSYTGKVCWAGVDWLVIDSKGFTKGSECGGRDIGNVFDHDWLPPDIPFTCPMMYCHHRSDRDNIRIEI